MSKANKNSSVAIKIVPASAKILSKNQNLFNKLTQQVVNLQAQIDNAKKKMDSLLHNYGKSLGPAEKELAIRQVELAKALGEALKRQKFSPKQKAGVKEAILDLCNHAFRVIEPDKDTIAFYDSYAEYTFKEAVDEQVTNISSEMADYLKDVFGIEIEMPGINASPEELAEFKKRLNEAYESQGDKNQNKKKTKKQLAQEANKKIEDGLKLKTIRELYISLAKVLHPDTESDPEMKIIKEEQMKRASLAYEAKDLHTLLQLEMEWLNLESRNLSSLAEDKLKVYISVLKQHISALKEEQDMLLSHPRYIPVGVFAQHPEKYALELIKQETKFAKQEAKDFANLADVIKQPDSKKKISYFVRDYLSAKHAFEEFGSLFDF